MAVGAVTTGGGIGSFTFPFIMAVLAQTMGIRGGFWFYLAPRPVLVAMAGALIRLTAAKMIGGKSPGKGISPWAALC